MLSFVNLTLGCSCGAQLSAHVIADSPYVANMGWFMPNAAQSHTLIDWGRQALDRLRWRFGTTKRKYIRLP